MAQRGFLDGIPDPVRGGFLMAFRGFLDGIDQNGRKIAKNPY